MRQPVSCRSRTSRCRPCWARPTAERRGRPTQLPTALLDAPHALAVTPNATWAVLANHDVAFQPRGSQVWTTVATPTAIESSGQFTPQGVVSSGSSAVFVIGSRTTPGATTYISVDEGRSWYATGGRTSSAASAAAPCRNASFWLLPVVTKTSVTVYKSTSAAGPWTSSVVAAGVKRPIVECSGGAAWVVVSAQGDPRQQVESYDGTKWSTGVIGSGTVTALAPTSATTAYAVSSDHKAVLELVIGQLPATTKRTLPAWVATVGGPAMRN